MINYKEAKKIYKIKDIKLKMKLLSSSKSLNRLMY